MQRILTLLLITTLSLGAKAQCEPDYSNGNFQTTTFSVCDGAGFDPYGNDVVYLENVNFQYGTDSVLWTIREIAGSTLFTLESQNDTLFMRSFVLDYPSGSLELVAKGFNSCGFSQDEVVSTILYDVNESLLLPECTSNYETKILGATTVEKPQSGSKVYVLDSPEIREHKQRTSSNFVYYQYRIENANNWVQYELISSSDTVLTLDSIPYDTTIISVRYVEGFECVCTHEIQPLIASTTVYLVDPSANPNKIKGNVKYTAETDCSRQNNAGKVLMKLSGSFGTQYGYTDDNGNYEFIVSGTGSGAVEVANKDFVQNMCSGQSPKRNFTFNGSAQTKTEDFAFIANAKMNITSVGRAQMQSVSDGYKQQISIQNLGKPLQGNLVWSTPNKGSAGKEQINGSTGKSAASNSTTQVLWTNVSIGFNQSLSFDITAQMNSNAVPGEYVASTIKFITASETFEFETGVEIRNSYDPNDKQVSHRNITPDVAANNPPTLLYHIRFQNTGNDTAYNIRIVDTLDQLLDLNTLAIGNSSHNVITDINFEERIVTWQFNNIMLPDSSTDLEGSQGYINMFVKPQKGLGEGRFIDNYVDIFFDLNPPVRTNTARTTISSTSSIAQLQEIPEPKLWPNPNKGKFYLENSGGYTEVLIYSLDGKLMHQQKLLPSNEVDASGLAKGTYLVQVQGGAKAPAISRVLVE